LFTTTLRVTACLPVSTLGHASPMDLGQDKDQEGTYEDKTLK